MVSVCCSRWPSSWSTTGADFGGLGRVELSDAGRRKSAADVYYSVAMGSDIGHMPVQTLVDFDGLPHCQTATKSATISEGNYIIVQGKKKSQLPIVLGVVVQCPRNMETWYCTSRSLLLNFILHVCTLLLFCPCN